MARTPVSEKTRRGLALRCGIGVRDARDHEGRAERPAVFLAAPKLRRPGEAEGARAPRVQWSLWVREGARCRGGAAQSGMQVTVEPCLLERN